MTYPRSHAPADAADVQVVAMELASSCIGAKNIFPAKVSSWLRVAFVSVLWWEGAGMHREDHDMALP
jgi:hypothetical protein